MRIVTWNCGRGPFAVNASALADLNPSVAVLQECGRPPGGTASCLWYGDNPNQGVAILATPPARIEAVALRTEAPAFIVPVRIRGPRDFLLFGVWTHKAPGRNYVQSLLRGLDVYADLIAAGPTVIMGDFNANAIWNHKRPTGRDFKALQQRLDGLGLASAYHAFQGEEFGAEAEPTHYFRHNEAAPFHIDYCFIPKPWVPAIRRVSVGNYVDWAERSDHRPLVVDLAGGDA